MKDPTGKYNRIVRRFVLLAVVMFGVIGVLYLVLMSLGRSMQCGDRMLTVYRALQAYEAEHGALPNLAFFPDDPMADPDSIRVALNSYGMAPDVWVCPSAHPVVASAGLGLVWNTRLNGRTLSELVERDWMLAEIEIISGTIPSRHVGGYNVLFSDGTVERIRDPAGFRL